MAFNIVPDTWRAHLGNQIIESIAEPANSVYYIFLGNHVPRATANVPAPVDDNKEIFVDVYHNMICGKRFDTNDVSLMIANIPFQTGVVFDMYNDADPQISTKNYFAIVNAGAYSHVWKCLDNNNESNTAVAPNISDIDTRDEVALSDGYRWKYLYSVDSTTIGKFNSSAYFPLSENASVTAIAVDGAVDVIQVVSAGLGYNNYLTGTFGAGEIRVGGNTQTYSVSSNTIASSVNGFYTGCMLYISAGTGVGQFKKITDYYINSTGKYVVTNSQFATTPVNGDQWQLYPEVEIKGDGKQTINARARALVNSVGNSIYRVEMMQRGAGYKFISANVMANAVVGVTTTANLNPIYSPPGGHGSNTATELHVSALGFAINLVASESNTIPITNQFQQYGIIQDPLFNNVAVNLANATSVNFSNNEILYSISPRLLATGATTNLSTNVVTLVGGHFDLQLRVGDQIYLDGKTTAANKQLAVVNAVTNSSQIVLDTACLFTDANTYVYLAGANGSGTVMSRSGLTIYVKHLDSQWGAGDLLIGNSSGATGYVNTISINDVTKGFNTFIGMNKYSGSYSSGIFDENEKVYEGDSLANSTANASLHSAVSNGSTIIAYVSNQVGRFSSQLIGANSGAVFSISSSYSPEIEFGSGRVLYLENLNGVTRSANTSENFCVIYSF